MIVYRHALSWYVAKLEVGEPFTSLLYGDGEFQVMLGNRTGQRFTQYTELVTTGLRDEMLASLTVPGADIVRGTDPNLLNYTEYEGRDFRSLWELGRQIEDLLTRHSPPTAWVDGVVWDRAARDGELGPLLKALRVRHTVLVGNTVLGPVATPILDAKAFVPVPGADAWAEVDRVEGTLLQYADRASSPVFALCCGLSAVPLAMRLRAKVPGCTVLDLGSVLDVFAGIGAERGWRAHLYAQPGAREALVAKNLEGVC